MSATVFRSSGLPPALEWERANRCVFSPEQRGALHSLDWLSGRGTLLEAINGAAWLQAGDAKNQAFVLEDRRRRRAMRTSSGPNHISSTAKANTSDMGRVKKSHQCWLVRRL